MNKKELFNGLKELFSFEDEETEVAKFVDYKSGDKIIRVSDELEVDVAIVEVTEDGEVKLDDGSYELEDLNITLVVKDGMVSEIIDDEKEDEDTETAEVVETEENLESDELPSAHIELPVGTHVIASKTYVVIEVTENEGTEDEFKRNVISELTGEAEAEADAVVETDENLETIEDLESDKKVKELETKLSELTEKFNKLSGEASEEPLENKINFSEMTSNDKMSFYVKGRGNK